MSQITILDQLKQRGYRSSAVRRALLETLLAAGKLGADDLRDRLLLAGHHPNRTTVYRELEMLVREGFVFELDFGEGKKRYELSDGTHHHHLYCRQCSAIECFQIGPHLAAVEAQIMAERQFQVQNHHLEFFGMCARCQNHPT